MKRIIRKAASYLLFFYYFFLKKCKLTLFQYNIIVAQKEMLISNSSVLSAVWGN